MWCLSGIFRDVYILQRPKQAHITDYHLQTPLQLPQSGAPAASLKAAVHVSAEVLPFRTPCMCIYEATVCMCQVRAVLHLSTVVTPSAGKGPKVPETVPG